MPGSVATATSGESAVVDQDDHAADRLIDPRGRIAENAPALLQHGSLERVQIR